MYNVVRVSADIARHRAWLEEDLALGCQAIYLHHVGREVDRFIDVFGSEVLPALRGTKTMGMHENDAS